MTYPTGAPPQAQAVAPPSQQPTSPTRAKTKASNTRRFRNPLVLLIDNKISLPEFAIVLGSGYLVSLVIDLATLHSKTANPGLRGDLYVMIFSGLIALLMLVYMGTNIRGGKFPVWTANLSSFAIGLGFQPYLTVWLLSILGVR